MIFNCLWETGRLGQPLYGTRCTNALLLEIHASEQSNSGRNTETRRKILETVCTINRCLKTCPQRLESGTKGLRYLLQQVKNYCPQVHKDNR